MFFFLCRNYLLDIPPANSLAFRRWVTRSINDCLIEEDEECSPKNVYDLRFWTIVRLINSLNKATRKGTFNWLRSSNIMK